MSDTLWLDRASGILAHDDGRRFDLATHAWSVPSTPDGRDRSPAAEAVGATQALRWLALQWRQPMRVPVGVIGPREANATQLATAEAIGAGIARLGLVVLCGGRGGVMLAACKGAAGAGGLSIGLLPEADPALANPYAGVVIATGIGEARNALIARAALCLVVIGDSFGTLSEVALGRQFGKRVIGLEGAARVEGVLQVADVPAALEAVARCALGLDAG